MAQHLSIFVENKPGKLEKITRILGEAGINIRAVSLASGGSFGVLKLMVGNPAAAAEALTKEHLTVSLRRIIVAVVDDRPGALHDVLAALSAGGINIEDCYGFVLENKKTAAIVVEVEKDPAAAQVLAQRGIRVLTDEEIPTI